MPRLPAALWVTGAAGALLPPGQQKAQDWAPQRMPTRADWFSINYRQWAQVKIRDESVL